MILVNQVILVNLAMLSIGESGDLINKAILVILVNKLILINCVGVVIF